MPSDHPEFSKAQQRFQEQVSGLRLAVVVRAAYSVRYIDPAWRIWEHGDEMPSFLVVHIGRTSPITQSRNDLRGHIRELPGSDHLDLECAWVVESEETADEIRDRLKLSVPAEDGLLVLGIGEQAAWRGLCEQEADWLVEHL
jgi:hypothetical protein